MSGQSGGPADFAAYWQRFLATLPPDSPTHGKSYVAEPFGDSPEMADELGALVMAGVKTATCSALWAYEAENEPIPQVGDLWIILDGGNQPLGIVETTEVVIRAYQQVDARFARDEGEGDGSLAYWRRAHWEFFSRTLPAVGKAPSIDMPLVCERFRVVYR
jgi:uncharacterized protein YhfF